MSSKPSCITGMHHASLVVADTRIALDFYEGLLGLACDPGRPDLGYPGAWLNVPGPLDQQIHLLEVPNPDPVSGRPSHGGRDRHLAFHVRDLDGLQERLEHAGFSVSRSRSGRRALFCRDPDGNGLEFMELD